MPSKNRFSVDLVRFQARLTHYTLQHYVTWDTEALRSWDLEASNDGRTWKTLMQHKADESLDAKGKAVTWPLPSASTSQAYRIFRVTITFKIPPAITLLNISLLCPRFAKLVSTATSTSTCLYLELNSTELCCLSPPLQQVASNRYMFLHLG